jgi:hypothetical protein
VFSRDEAIQVLGEGHAAASALLDRLPAAALTRPGLEGGEWSPVDLVAHLAFWERNALEALDAWSRGQTAPIDRALRDRGLNPVNAEAVVAARALAPADALRTGDETHRALMRAMRELSDERWLAPPTRRGRRSLARRLGGILGGPGGGFRHADAHLPGLEAFVAGPLAARRGPA